MCIRDRPEESLFYKELREQLAAAIDSLGEKERLVISLYYVFLVDTAAWKIASR